MNEHWLPLPLSEAYCHAHAYNLHIALFCEILPICTCAEYATWHILSYHYHASQPKILTFAPYYVV